MKLVLSIFSCVAIIWIFFQVVTIVCGILVDEADHIKTVQETDYDRRKDFERFNSGRQNRHRPPIAYEDRFNPDHH